METSELSPVECLNLYPHRYFRALAFLEEVKNTLGHRDKVDQFLRVTKDVGAQRIRVSPAVITRLKGLLRGHKALIVGLNEFLPEDQREDQLVECNGAAHHITKRFKKKKEDSSEPEEKQKVMKAGDDKKQKDLVDSETRLALKRKSLEELDKLIQKNVGKQCQPEMQNKSFSKPLLTSGGKLAERVKSTRGDYNFNKKRESEKNRFQCEDDHFELDMLVERMAATAHKVAELVDYIKGPQFEMCTFVLEDHLNAIHLRCIEAVYGQYASTFIKLFRENPAKALPLLLVRLNQKHHEWSLYRTEMNKVWAGFYSKNDLAKAGGFDELT